jgi:hypothetical protein
MIAYTIKLKVNTCHLIYPDYLGIENDFYTHYEIEHGDSMSISKIFYHRIPALIKDDNGELDSIIQTKEQELYEVFNQII